MKINVNSLNGKITLDVEKTDNVASVKRKIFDLKGIF
jgi:hypothetical protein